MTVICVDCELKRSDRKNQTPHPFLPYDQTQAWETKRRSDDKCSVIPSPSRTPHLSLSPWSNDRREATGK